MRLAPGARIGVMGGGQLGRMTALAAARLGYRCHVFAPEPDSPAAQVTDRATVAAYDDAAALERFAAAVDVVTIEFENLPVAPLVRLAELAPVRPAPAVLAICQDRLREKHFLNEIGVATAPWRPVQAADELARAQAELAGPLVLKTARFGYDGKGQVGLAPEDDPAVLAICQDRLREKHFLNEIGVATAPWRPVQAADELARAQTELAGPLVLKTARFGYDGKGQIGLAPEDDPAAAWARFGRVPGIAEARIDFACEVSVITARAEDGTQTSYPAVENRHEAHVLAQTIVPARIGAGLAAEARAVAERIARELELVGLLAVEMFVTQGQRLLVNELAPRPHNSGHWTIDACAISQFELLIRAICGLPLHDPGRFADAVMDNLLGPAVEAWPELLAEPGARLHLYGKDEVRAGRKLGHVTRLTRPL